MRLTIISKTVFAICLASLAACGGGGDDRLLSSLSDADFVEVCEDQEASLSDADIAGLIGFECLLAEAFQQSCDQARLDACIESTTWEGFTCEAPEADDPIRTCDATVDEMRDCVDAQYAALQELADATCADLETFGGELPAACEPVQQKCPELFE